MGQEILYCSVCRGQLRGADFDKGKAVKSGMEAYCTDCLPEDAQPDITVPTTDTPRRMTPSPTGRRPSASSTKTQTVRDGDTGTFSTRRFAGSKRKSSNTGVIVGGAVGAVVLILIIGIAAGSSSSSAPSPQPPPPAPLPPVTKTPVKPPTPPPTAARPPRGDLEKQKEAVLFLNAVDAFAEANPDQLEEIVKRYEKGLALARETEEFARARSSLMKAERALEESRKDVGMVARTALVKQAEALFTRRKFKEVMDLLRKADAEKQDRAWQGQVEEIRLDYRKRFRAVFEPLRDEAMAARKAGNEKRAEEIRKTVAGFGLKGMAGELETALAKATPKPKADPAVAVYDKAWLQAMEFAGIQEYSRALEMLQEAAAPLKDEKARKLAAFDIETIRRIDAVSKSLEGSTRSWKKGTKLILRYRDPRGALQVTEGTVEEVRDGRVYLEDGRAIEEGEIALSSLVAAKPDVPVDAGLGAMILFTEGDSASAKKLLGKGWDNAPERYRTWKGAALAAGELAARRLYYGALPTLGDPLRASEGVAGIKTLLEKHADTAFVRRNRAAIDRAAEQGREFFLTGARMTGAGIFARVKTEEIPVAWVARADSTEAERRNNYVEITFAAVPGEKYRLWMWVGGCCAEVLTFYAQGTELKIGRSGPEATPGSEHEARVKQYVLNSRRKHSDHGGPKTPEKWGWVMLPLPAAYETGGEKKVRIVSDQKGFGVGYAFLSTTSKSAPKESSFEEIANAVPAAAALPRAASGLVALYTFREGKGDVVKDVSGVGAAMDLKIQKAGAVEWIGDHGLRVKSSVKLFAASEKKMIDAIKESKELTVEAWVTPASADQMGPARIISLSKDSGSRAFTMGQGVSKTDGTFSKSFQMRLHSSGAKKNGYPQFKTPNGSSTDVLTHLVYTRKADGQERFYINGKEEASGVRTGDFAHWKTDNEFILANERTGDRPWLGEFYLVAVYQRALTPDEVTGNYSAGPK